MATSAFNFAGPNLNGSFNYEPIEGDSLTRLLRSTTNYLGGSGQEMLKSGQGLFSQGVNTFSQPLDYWSKILSGDKGAMTEALAPDIQNIGDQYSAAMRGARMNMPRGGARDVAMANMPFQQARDVGNLYATLRPQAANQVGNIASMLSQFGLSETGVGSQTIQQMVDALLNRRGQNVNEHGQMMGLAGGLAGAAMGKLPMGGKP